MASLTNMEAEPRLHDAHPGPGRRTDRAASHVYPAVELADVKVVYRPGGPPALEVPRLEIGQGERVAIIGPSGAGKTTLLRLINGFVRPEAGEIMVQGERAMAMRRRDLRRRIGYIFQDFRLIERASAFQNVLCGRLGRADPWLTLVGAFSANDREIAMKAIEEVGLAGLAAKRADSLSGGEQQRVAIARVLAQEAEIILADEPVSSLDPVLTDDILGLLVEVSERHGATLIMALHQPVLAQRHGTRIIGLNAGRSVFDGAPEKLDSRALAEIYRRGPSRESQTAPAPPPRGMRDG